MKTSPEYRAELRIRAEIPGVWGSKVVNDLLEDIENLTRERDKVIEHAISLVSHLCPEHLEVAKATPFPQFCEQEAVKGCEVCLLQRAENAEKEVVRLRENLKTYGYHKYSCASWYSEENPTAPDNADCTCGLRAAVIGEGGE